MATQNQFNNALKYKYGKSKYSEGIQGAQELWANQYIENPNANEVGRYLDYTNILNLKGINKTQGGGKNITDAQHDFFNKYSNAIKTGTNNLSQLKQYQGYAKAFGLQAAAPDENVLRQISIAALNGSKGAQNYLTTMGLKPQSGANLWKGVNGKSLQTGSGAWNQYYKDNPYSSVSRDYEKHQYDVYAQRLANGEQLSPTELKAFQNASKKWNMTDLTDPMELEIYKMGKEKDKALEGQDIALNQSLSAIDAKNFQTMQAAEQNMANKGLLGSGIAADAYQRATMASNQDLQKAYADSATKKSEISGAYADKISQLKLASEEQKQKAAIAQQEAAIELQKLQTDQDKFLTSQSGYIWIGGKPLTGADGKPITTMDWQKLSETQRHNLQQEALDAQKNNNSFQLGMLNANNDATRIANQLSIAQGQMALDLKNFELNSQKFQVSSAQVQQELANAAIQTTNEALKIQLTALQSQLKEVTDRAQEYTKKGKKVPKDLEKQIQELNNKIQEAVGKVQGEQ